MTRHDKNKTRVDKTSIILHEGTISQDMARQDQTGQAKKQDITLKYLIKTLGDKTDRRRQDRHYTVWFELPKKTH